jgi:hypothetical protein
MVLTLKRVIRVGFVWKELRKVLRRAGVSERWAVEELGNAQTQSRTEPVDCYHGDVALTGLNAADVSSVQAGALRQQFLRDTLPRPNRAQTLSERLKDLNLHNFRPFKDPRPT